jgi:hypothetical protein
MQPDETSVRSAFRAQGDSMDLEKSGNLIEAALWLAISLALVVKASLGSNRLRRTLVLLAVTFVAFGASDLIESETGAWWRPPWLLALKGLCVVGIVLGFGAYFRIIKRRPTDADNPWSCHCAVHRPRAASTNRAATYRMTTPLRAVKGKT